jgi:hypothetical protein
MVLGTPLTKGTWTAGKSKLNESWPLVPLKCLILIEGGLTLDFALVEVGVENRSPCILATLRLAIFALMD